MSSHIPAPWLCTRTWLITGALSAAVMLAPPQLAAQQYPVKPIRIIVGSSAGGGGDTLARLMAQAMTSELGQQVIVDNRPGAGGNLGADIVAKAPADGYTLLFVFSGHATNPSLYPKLPFDTVRDFAPITMLATNESILVVHPSLPVKSVKESVIEIWQELWAMSRWKDPADLPTSGEIAYPNLPHTQCVVAMALSVADAFSKYHKIEVNRDHLIAAAVLQDASKVVEYEPGPDGKARRTDIGKNYGHGFWCAHLAVQKGVPHEISHVMLTHSSSAAKFPDTLEGKILYYVDQLDVIGIHKDRWKKHLMIAKAE